MKLDLTQLRTISGEDPAFMTEILELVARQSPAALQQMEALLDQHEYRQLGAIAHRHKSSVNILGCMPLTNLMKTIELTATEYEQPEALPGLIDEFRSVNGWLMDAIRAELELLRVGA
jgi:HPt (histidine-containing phosphotransfer) domain-containing protein